MRHASIICFLLLAATAAFATAIFAEAPRDGSSAWLNVRECGASGSAFETTAVTTAGSNRIVVANAGDFQVGQGVMVSRCNVRYMKQRLWGPGEPYSNCKPLGDAVEIRGYDGSAGSWLVYLLEVDGANPPTFRWSDDCARTWKAVRVPITFDWQKLSAGIEVKFKRQNWQPGHMVTFSARDQLVSTIEKIEGTTLILKDAANRSASDAVVLHCDNAALQAAVDRAIREQRNVFIPAGHYRLAAGIVVRDAAITIEGQSGENTLLDIINGEGPCINLRYGREVTIRDFRMIGHTGLAEAAGSFRTSSGFGFWACALKGCNAVSICGTERVLIENVHASRMASECFYSQGPSRTGTTEPPAYTKSLTYLRCSVTDCAANAFNNNDTAENTSVLYCRIDGAGWHAWEGPSRFIRLIGNYVRNAGPFTVGDMSHRLDSLHTLGCGQAVVTDNVFEGIGRCGGIAVNHGATQVTIAHNLFINYNGPAITASSYTVRTSYPSQNITISGNLIDMTYDGEKPQSRTGITVSAADTTVSDNQIYVRGRPDPRVTGIFISEPAVNVNVHDNLVQGCEYGIRTGRAASRVTEVVDPTAFLENGLPLEWRTGHRYRGWNLVWLSGNPSNPLSVIDAFDPESLRFKLTTPHEMKVGDRFEVFPNSADWQIHNNTVTGCLHPVVLDSNGSETSWFTGNTISRGGATGVPQAVEVRGRFNLIGNHICGFDEAGASALSLFADRLGLVQRNIYRGNLFAHCTNVVTENPAGLWTAEATARNEYVDCPGR